MPRALRPLALRGVPYAEAWRRLIPVAVRIEKPRPSYKLVREFMERERELGARRRAARDEVLVDLAKQRIPRLQ